MNMEGYTEKSESDPEFKVHKVGVDEWEKLRDIRTRAISDSPQAFGDTIEQTRSRADEEWKRWTTSNVYAIETNDRFVATVSWIKHPDYGDYIVGVWTDPDYRGKGLNRMLFEQIFADAKERGVEKITLHVNVEQESALRSYQNLGFEIIGDAKQKKMGDEKLHDEYLMVKRLV
jgi:ribosomal protein S18 acetylase RimI-like enzyme